MSAPALRRGFGAAGAVLLMLPAAVLPARDQAKKSSVVPAGVATIQPSRLTVRQFQNSITDLVGDDQAVVPDVASGGLHGEYFEGRDQSAKAKGLDRIDGKVDFDFGANPPDGCDPKTFDPHEFTIVWHGSVFAPDSGDYDFVVRSNQSVKLFVNGWRAPLVDGSIRSANQTEFRGTLRLLGGRAYPLRLEFQKVIQGVNDGKAKARPSAPAAVSLLWRPPRRALAPIPAWCLYPRETSPWFVLTTPFPPDDRSQGYERGDRISKEWEDAVTNAAIETADYVADNINSLAGVRDEDRDRNTKVEEFCRQLVRRAFFRSIDAESERRYVDRQFASGNPLETAVKRVVLLTIESPRFLARDEDDMAQPKAIAENLSYLLWDTLPDRQLTKDAESGALNTQEGIAKEAARMAQDPRTWNKLRDFLLEWLKVDDIPEIVKDRKSCGGFDGEDASDLRESFELFLRNTAWSDASDYRELMTSRTLYLDGRLAKLYGADLPPNAPFQAVPAPAGTRDGVLTQPYLLSRFAYVNGSSPIHRGVLVIRNMLGRVLNPPPAAFVPFPASAHPDLTTRQRVSLQTEPNFCQSCHSIINPLGFTLERYDAIGRIRDSEAGKPIDCSGHYVASNGVDAKFSGPADLAKYVSESDDAHRAFVQKLFQFMTKQSAVAYGKETVPTLVADFSKNRYSIRRLMVEAAVYASTPKSAPTVAAKVTHK